MPKKHDATFSYKLLDLFYYLFIEGKELSYNEICKKYKCSKANATRLIRELENWLGSVSLFSVLKKIKLKQGKVVIKSKLIYNSSDISIPVREQFSMIRNIPSEKLESLLKIQEAIKERRLLGIKYQSSQTSNTYKEHVILPLKIFSYHGIPYIYAWKLPDTYKNSKLYTFINQKTEKECEDIFKTKKNKIEEFMFMLNFLRVKCVCDVKFSGTNEWVKIHYNRKIEECLDKIYSNYFGVIKQDNFKSIIKINGPAAPYIKERYWSEDQKIKELYSNGDLLIKFTCTSKLELKSWVLSFGSNAKLIIPRDLQKEIRSEINRMLENYK